jgi:hypothetical protein
MAIERLTAFGKACTGADARATTEQHNTGNKHGFYQVQGIFQIPGGSSVNESVVRVILCQCVARHHETSVRASCSSNCNQSANSQLKQHPPQQTGTIRI